MCGIAGIVQTNTHGELDPAPLEAMNAAQAHRGPDDAGVWREGPAGLAHRRLSILDTTPAGHQPMRSADGRLVVVYNGELYNHAELRAGLEKEGAVFRSRCDTEVLVEALARWGDSAIERFNGMFAFAAYDRETRRLLLARDRLGIKPLFYTLRNGTLAFASELGALVRGDFVGDVDPGALDAYFTYLYIPAPDTVFKGVHKLRPGECAVFEKGGLRLEQYWKPRYAPDAGWTLDSAAERFLELLQDSVRLRRVSDVPLGAFLSGGLDSSAVVSTLAGLVDRPVKTFSIGFDDAHADELAYARVAARHAGTGHTEEMLAPDMVALAPRIAAHFAEPFADSSALPVWLVCEVARREVTVALSGDGGDELFGGYTWMHRNHDVARYRRAPAAVRRLVGAGLALSPASPRWNKLRRFNADTFLTPDESFRRRLTCFAPEQRRAMLRAYATPPDRFLEHAAAAAAYSANDRMLYIDTCMYLPDDILTKVDRMSMAHGLEARVPLLDHRMVEFAATVPFELKYAGGVSKRLVKHAMRDRLPAELLRQRKRGFAIAIQRWFREDLAAHYRDAVLGGDARCGAWLDPRHAGSLLEEHLSGRAAFGHHLWAVLMFEHWLRNLRSASRSA